MFMLALPTVFLVLSRTRAIGDGPEQDSSDTSALRITPGNINLHPLYIESTFHKNHAHPSRRRLLERPRSDLRIKQAYRNSDYIINQGRRQQRRCKPDESKSYRSVVKVDEDEDDEEDEEDEENEIDDETLDEEAEQETDDEEDQETVEDTGRKRMVRSGYVPFEDKVDDPERQEAMRIRSVSEKCEDESTEAPQYYEYEVEVKNSGEFPEASAVELLGVILLTFLLI